MKKRVLMFAVVMGMLLSICSPVWAGVPAASRLESVVAAYRKKYNVEIEGGSTFTIPVQAQIAIASSTLSGYTAGKADKVEFSITKSPEGSFVDVALASSSLTDIASKINDTDTFAFGTDLTGTAKGNGTITITGKAYIGSTVLGTDTAIIEFSTADGEDEIDTTFMLDGPNKDVPVVTPSAVEGTAGDPESDKWDGKDPTFGTKGGNGTDKPKIATSTPVFSGEGYAAKDKALKSGVPATFEIEIQGPGPEINVYVSAKDAKKLWPLRCDKKWTGEEEDWKEDIPLTKENIKEWNIPFRVTADDTNKDETQDKNTKHKLTIAYNGAQVAYKGFPITISAENDKTVDSKGVKPVTKTYKIDIVSDKQVPQWVTPNGKVGEKLAKKNAQEISVPLAGGGTLGGTIYTVSADGPYYITSKGDKIGMSADVTQPELNRFGEVTTPGYVKVHGTFDGGDKGTKGGTKEVKVAFTLDAIGSVKKTSFKPTVVGKVAPYFDSKNLVSSADKDTSYAGLPKIDKTDYEGYYKVKTAEAGKVPAVKFAAKGSKTIEYILTEGGDELAAYGLSFDVKKGQVIQDVVDGTKVSPTATVDDDGEYAPVLITVVADNGAGTSDPVSALVGVTGAKAKPYLRKDEKDKEIKVLSIPQNAEVGDCFAVYALVGKEEAGENDNVYFRLTDAKKAKKDGKELDEGEDTYALENLGLEFIPSSEFTDEQKAEYRNRGVFKVVGTLKAVKSQKVNLIVSNLGNEQKGSVTIAIVDATPEIAGEDAIEVTAGDKVTKTYTLSAGTPTNGAKIDWKIATKLDTKSKLSAKLSNPKNGKDTDYTQAILEVTANADATDGTLTITAENAESKLKSEEFTVAITVKAKTEVDPDENESAPKKKKTTSVPADGVSPKTESEAEAEAETESEEPEDALEFGAQRTVDQLTADQTAFLAKKGYTVIAVLPEVTAKEDGQYEFEVELDEDAPEGAKLIWLAFPKNAEEAEDDKIADFYDESGTAIDEVPAGKVIVVAPWLRADVTYQPVIAVED